MKHLGLKSRIRRKKVNRKRIKPEYTAENILSRNFVADKPNDLWLTDVTEFKINGESKRLYFSPILNLYDKSIITYDLSYRNNNQLVFKMFDDALIKYPLAKPISIVTRLSGYM